MTRITQASACAAVQAVLTHKYKPVFQEFEVRAVEAIRKIISEYLGKDEEVFNALSVRLKEPLTPLSAFRIVHNDDHLWFNIHSFVDSPLLSVFRRWANLSVFDKSCNFEYENIFVPAVRKATIQVSTDLYNKVADLFDDRANVIKEIKEDAEALCGILAGYRTVEKLERDHPELAAVFEKEEKKVTALVAVTEEAKEQVRERFNLPIE